MNNNEIILKTIKYAINQKKIEEEIDLKNNKELCLILKEQTFLPMFYFVTKNSLAKPYYISSILLHEQFDNVRTIINDLFNQNGIKHIFLKGSSIQFLYPDRNIRMLGDIDVLIENKNLKKAIKVLKQNNFIYQERASHHIGFQYNNIEVELHFKIIEYRIKLAKYLTNPFNNAYQIDQYNYELNPEYNLIFIIAHYMKHLKGGSGLRSIIDIYLLINKNNIDLNKVRTIFKQYKCEQFFDCILSMLDIIFDYNNYPYNKNENADELITYSLNSGIHGFGKNNNYMLNKENASSNNKFIFLLKQWFIPIKQLFDFYPWTKTIILIPLGYIVRLFHLFFKRQKELKLVLKNKKNDNSLFKKIGLK